MTNKDIATVDANTALATASATSGSEPTSVVYTAKPETTAVLEATPSAPETGTPNFNTTATTQPSAPAPAPSIDRYRGLAITSFVLGIVSIVLGWSFVAPIIGLILGLVALNNNTSERKLALWGAWLNGAILALATLVFIFSVAFAGAAILSLPFYPW